MSKREDRLKRMRAVEREHRVAHWAANVLREQLERDPGYLKRRELTLADYRQFQAKLAATYLIRLFAEFETGLREVWKSAYGRPTHPKASDLMKGIGARCTIPYPWQELAHRVRLYRNNLVHERDIEARPIFPSEGYGHLSRFFSRVPLNW